MKTVVVTRHQGLVELLREMGLVTEGVEVVAHATEEVVRGNNVFGVLPFRLAALCGRFTEVSLNVPAELRGKELSLEQVKSCDPQLTTWVVRKEEDVCLLTDCFSPEVDAGDIVRLEDEGWRMVKTDFEVE